MMIDLIHESAIIYPKKFFINALRGKGAIVKKFYCLVVVFSFFCFTSARAEEETLLQKAERLQAQLAAAEKKAEEYKKKVEELKRLLPPPPTQAEIDEDMRLRLRSKELLKKSVISDEMRQKQKELMERKY